VLVVASLALHRGNVEAARSAGPFAWLLAAAGVAVTSGLLCSSS
jgi:hypothetical protein